MSGTLHLSWTPPPTIDLTDIDPDLHYNVTITKTVSRADESVDISCMECPLLTPEYSFTPDPCVTYTFSVFAFNAAGKGEIKSLQYSLCLGWYFVIVLQIVTCCPYPRHNYVCTYATALALTLISLCTYRSLPSDPPPPPYFTLGWQERGGVGGR